MLNRSHLHDLRLKIVRYRVLCLGFTFLIVGMGIWVVVSTHHWKSASWEGIISSLLSAGCVAVVFELASSDKAELRLDENTEAISGAILRSLELRLNLAAIRDRLAPEAINDLIAACLEVRLGEQSAVPEFMERLEFIDSAKATKDYRVHARVSRAVDPAYIDVVIRYRYECLLDYDSYLLRGLARDDGSRPEEQLLFWLFDEDVKPHAEITKTEFDVLNFTVDDVPWHREVITYAEGRDVRVSRPRRDGRQGESAWRALDYEIRIRRNIETGTLYLPITNSCHGVEIEFSIDEQSTGLEHLRLLDFMGTNATKVARPFSQSGFRLQTRNWVLPVSGVVLTWKTADDVERRQP